MAAQKEIKIDHFSENRLQFDVFSQILAIK
jgi:hypothetical protein